MAPRPAIHWPTGARTVFFDDVASRATLSKAVRDGRIRRIAPRLYSADLESSADEIVLANRWPILGRLLPGALIADRSAAEDGRVTGGRLFVVADTTRKSIGLPGLEVRIRPGTPFDAPVADPLWSDGLRMSSPARTLLDNLTESRRRDGKAARTLTLSEIEDWLARKAIAWDIRRIERLRTEATALAEAAGAADRLRAIEQLFEHLSGDSPPRAHAGRLLVALREGRAWDEHRMAMFERVASQLSDTADWDIPDGLPASTQPEEVAFYEAYLSQVPGRRTVPSRVPDELPLYEAYFSNYIEGTVFTLDEARRIIESNEPPASRPADGHDILGTYRCVADPVGRRATSEDPERLILALRERHQAIQAGRPDMGPGQWKTEANSVGGYPFVEPALVEGTLRKGLGLMPRVRPGFWRALYVLFVVTEVHPFTDGNGRVARVMMNAELSAVGQARIVIPSVYRNEYIASLRRASTQGGDVRALARVLAHAWRWTAAMPWSERAATEGQLHATNALIDATDAQHSGARLDLP